MRRILFLLLIQLGVCNNYAQQLKGIVTDAKGQPLSFSSIYIKGSTRGTVANKDGRYFLDLPAGNYTVVCAHVGYEKIDSNITLATNTAELNFQLHEQVMELKSVEVKPNAEDPAYAIIRKAIQSRKDHLDQIKQWQVMVYMKGLITAKDAPVKAPAKKWDFSTPVVDSAERYVLYLSESLTKYSRRLPGEYHEEVISAKESGNSNGIGFNTPRAVEFNFYENVTKLGSKLNGRGFISPISDNAFYFYRYKYEGTFYEDGLEINKIRVIPKRKFEPCYAGGYINIIEGSWQIHAVDLYLTKESQMDVLDTLHIVQQMFPIDHKFWVPQQSHLSGSLTILQHVAEFSFAALFSDYNIDKSINKVFEKNVVKLVDSAATKRSLGYWDTLRPVPLTAEEQLDYLQKDTLERLKNSPDYLDSLNKRNNRLGLYKLLIGKPTITDRERQLEYRFEPLIKVLQYNTVEGAVINFQPTILSVKDTGAFVIQPSIRYGCSNQHFNAMLSVSRTFGKAYDHRWTINAAGGKYVFQLNPGNPIYPIVNTIYTLWRTKNYMKLYENAFGKLQVQHAFKNGLSFHFSASYEDRFPLQNSDTSYSWRKGDKNDFTSNYPEEVPAGQFDRHQAFITGVYFQYQPGQKFVQYPEKLVSLGSNKPLFTASFVKAWPNLFGADAAFGKWHVGVFDEFNMKLGGSLKYRIGAGGFINNKEVQLPDWQHFNGNQTFIAGEYVNSFQLAPYYANSTKDGFFTTGHLEWHWNGLLTNKIPLIRRWNWGIVTGTNAFYVDKNRNYFEFFAGVENIFKTMRIDFVWGYDGVHQKPTTGIVLGFAGLFSNGSPNN